MGWNKIAPVLDLSQKIPINSNCVHECISVKGNTCFQWKSHKRNRLEIKTFEDAAGSSTSKINVKNQNKSYFRHKTKWTMLTRHLIEKYGICSCRGVLMTSLTPVSTRKVTALRLSAPFICSFMRYQYEFMKYSQILIAACTSVEKPSSCKQGGDHP